MADNQIGPDRWRESQIEVYRGCVRSCVGEAAGVVGSKQLGMCDRHSLEGWGKMCLVLGAWFLARVLQEPCPSGDLRDCNTYFTITVSILHVTTNKYKVFAACFTSYYVIPFMSVD